MVWSRPKLQCRDSSLFPTFPRRGSTRLVSPSVHSVYGYHYCIHDPQVRGTLRGRGVGERSERPRHRRYTDLWFPGHFHHLILALGWTRLVYRDRVGGKWLSGGGGRTDLSIYPSGSDPRTPVLSSSRVVLELFATGPPGRGGYHGLARVTPG